MDTNRFSCGLAIAALGVGLGACGSSSKSSSETGGTLAKAELIAKVNSICAKAKSAASAIPAPASLQDPAVAAAYFGKIAPITDKETQDLSALKPASDVQIDYASFTAAQQQADTLLQTIKHKAEVKDPSGQRDLQKSPATGQQVADAANKLGATTCAQ